ncbi:DUF397 domain-containing protein [Streptomyces sp. AM 4-1-1]|uniref:DUF397 domain-containing protein n=1 Tax=Streptomyces sp. AM 4-1-1 TaxID=3028710 RepID=UPI0023B945E0|nr:DUF397 domain-containing protein [Streptomyces sp. AM 4-1-1]WEH34752.1 DUF397 domain-containing protein [Streptomyces sp. AM 4-1-1]
MQHTSIDLGWRASSYSSGNGQCLEVQNGTPDIVPVRDSKDIHGPVLALHAYAWSAFLDGVKGDAFSAAG